MQYKSDVHNTIESGYINFEGSYFFIKLKMQEGENSYQKQGGILVFRKYDHKKYYIGIYTGIDTSDTPYTGIHLMVREDLKLSEEKIREFLGKDFSIDFKEYENRAGRLFNKSD